jgi:hypothetical protein
MTAQKQGPVKATDFHGYLPWGGTYIFSFEWRMDSFLPSGLRLEKANNFLGNVKRG